MPAAVEVAAEMEVSGDAGRRRFRGDSVMGERGILSGFRSNEFLRLWTVSILSRSSSLSLVQLELEICRRDEGGAGGSPIMPLSRGEGSANSLRSDRDDDPPE